MRYVYFILINDITIYIGSSQNPHYRFWSHYSQTGKSNHLYNALIKYFLDYGKAATMIVDCYAERSNSFKIEANYINQFCNLDLLNKYHNKNNKNFGNLKSIKINKIQRQKLEKLIQIETFNIKNQMKELCKKLQ